MTTVDDAANSGPPEPLVRALVEGPSLVRGLEWHPELGSTNARAADLARDGVPEIHVVLADRQTAGRGRRGRAWQAPPGTSLLTSFVLWPSVAPHQLGLLPLMVGTVLAGVADGHVGTRGSVALKWPNDLLLDGRKAAGILVEAVGAPEDGSRMRAGAARRPHDGSAGGVHEPAHSGAVVVGIGLNIDWRGVARPSELAGATSLAEATGSDVDRWRVLAGLAGVLSRRYVEWQASPAAFLDAYRRRCATIGAQVRVSRLGAEPVEGEAVAVAADGALEIATRGGTVVRLSAGDVEHVRRM